MPPQPVLRFRFPVVLAAMLGTSALAGCASTGSTPHPVAIDTPHALIDSYLIAHGMMLGYFGSGRAGPAEALQLLRYDRTAMIAVATASVDPGRVRTQRAQAAVGEMLRYTGELDLSGIPAKDAPDR